MDRPIISEEFLSYTGLGATIRFGHQKVIGESIIKTQDVCPLSFTEPLPGYNDECGLGGRGCGDLKVGKTRLDGIPVCALEDNDIKTKPVTPSTVSILGNVSGNSCDIYKVKGNKKIKYKLGKLFGENENGRYQLPNQYTLRYGEHYFYFVKKGNKIQFRDYFDPIESNNYAFNVEYGEDKYGIYILIKPLPIPNGDSAKYLTRTINIFDKHFEEWKLEIKKDTIDDVNQDYIRDQESQDKKIVGKKDIEFYSQKFNFPDDLVLKIATQEGIKSESLDKMKENLEKSNYVFCNVGGQGGNSLCKGDSSTKPPMTLDEENEILRKQSSQITSIMKRFDNIPNNHFDRNPENQELKNLMKETKDEIKKASDFVYQRVKDVNWVVKTQIDSNQEVDMLNNQNEEKKSANNVMDNSTNDIETEGIMAKALQGMGKALNINDPIVQSQCKSIEGFSNLSPGPSGSKDITSMDRNISGRYYNYVQDQIDIKKKNIGALNEKIHNLLSRMNKLSDGVDLSGEKKQMLLSEMIQEKIN